MEAASAGGSTKAGAPQASASATSSSAPAAAKRCQDPLLNPLRSVLLRFSCTTCGKFDIDGRSSSADVFLCSRCLTGARPESGNYAYTSLIYGDAAHYVLGAIVLGQSLRKSGTSFDRVLLHTADVPTEARTLLSEWWKLKEVPYLGSALDLHTAAFYEKSRFKEVFTKLHVFNPVALPYDRVIFLDLDMMVLKNMDELFAVRPPAALYNVKSRGVSVPPRHGERMDARSTYINAGTMVVAPSRMLFELLCADSREADPVWHSGAWCPEQNYLSRVLAGEWSHISQLYNFEVQLHSGVPFSKLWEDADVTDIAVAHFSGTRKVWECEPDEFVPGLMNDWMKHTFAKLDSKTQISVTLRCRALHAEWHQTLASALKCCRQRDANGCLSVQIGQWAACLSTGTLHSTPALPSELTPPSFVGDQVVITDKAQIAHAATIVRVREGGEIVVRRVPTPAEMPWCGGLFGLCYARQITDALKPLEPPVEPFDLGSTVVVWSGEGHVQGNIVASAGAEYLVQYPGKQAPQWQNEREIQSMDAIDQVEGLQCTVTLRWSPGAFVRGQWYCEDCLGESAPAKDAAQTPEA